MAAKPVLVKKTNKKVGKVRISHKKSKVKTKDLAKHFKKSKKIKHKKVKLESVLPIPIAVAKSIASVIFEEMVCDSIEKEEFIDTDISQDPSDIETVKLIDQKKIKVSKDKQAQLQSVFDLDEVNSPLIGTPKEVQEELDGLALKMQKDPYDQEAFERILTYIHKYLLGLVFKKYNFVKGYEESDIYQEALIALFKKAVPNFDPTRNMSFLNFAKMCINRHLITILHASKHRRKDMPINNSVSLDHNPNSSDDDDDGSCSLSNIFKDEKTSHAPYRELARKESYLRTLEVIKSSLSCFEIMILEEYLAEKSYKEIAKCVTRRSGIKYNEKSCDNALLRIRKKAYDLLKDSGGIENLPLLF